MQLLCQVNAPPFIYMLKNVRRENEINFIFEHTRFRVSFDFTLCPEGLTREV